MDMDGGREVLSLSASEVAKLIAGEPSGSEEALIFGEIFHETFCYHLYIQDKYGPLRHGFRAFRRRLASRCRGAGLGREWITYGIRLAAAFIARGAEGRVPPTASVEIAGGIILYAKPDLETWRGRYIELKTQPATRYDRVQCMIFGLALDSEITLMYPGKARLDSPVEVIVEKIGPYPDKKRVVELIREYGRREIIYEENEDYYDS